MKTTIISCVVGVLSSQALFAQEEHTEGRIFVEGYISGSNSYDARENGFIEYHLDGNDSFFGHLYKDKELTSEYIGLTHSFTQGILKSLETGLGIGQAEFEDSKSLAFNPWIKYSFHGWELSSEFEYLYEDSQEHFYRTELTHEIAHHLYGGVYSEQHFGVGPLLGVHFGNDDKGLNLYATKATFNEGLGLSEGHSILYMTFYMHR